MPREPLIDIVMLVHDQWEWADLAIRAVEAFTKNPYRLILVDMASQKNTTKEGLLEAEERGHTVLRLAENRSFSHGVNAGVNIGTSKFVCVLNDDALVSEGWDTAMLQDASEKLTGMVGASSNRAAGPMGDPGFIGEPPYLVFVCVMLRRDVWAQVGPLDEENFTGFSSEDLDYSWRVVKHGYRLKVSKAFVYHAGSRTLIAQQTGDANAINQALAANNEKYNRVLLEKWGKEWVAEHTKMHTKVLVVSYHAEEWTRVKFAGSLVNLRGGGAPGAIEIAGERFGFSFYQNTRAPIHIARQMVCDYACDNGYDVLIQLDDDSTFPADVVPRLLRAKKEVVTALAYQRKPPYLPCIYEVEEGKLAGNAIQGWEHTGLRRVDVSGYHVSALRLSAIKKMREHRCEKHPEGIRQYFGGFENKVGEDFAFSHNLRHIGVPLWCDTSLIAGHIAEGFVIDENYKRAHAEGKAL